MTPGRKFSMTTSTDLANFSKAALPSSDFRSSVTLFLLRLTLRKKTLSFVQERRPERTQFVAAVWLFDLDDLGPEVAQQHRAVRTGDHPRQVQDADARQWSLV